MTPEQLKQAAQWHSRMCDVPAGSSRDAAQARFAAWQLMNNDHRQAVRAIAAAETLARDLRHEPSLRALGDVAFERAVAKSRRHRYWGAIALAGTVIVVPVAALSIHRLTEAPPNKPAPTPLQTIATGPGELRVVDLGNAVRVTLDTSSQLVVDGSTLRISGQAYVRSGSTPVSIRLRGSTVIVRSGGINVRTTATGAIIFAEGTTVTIRRNDEDIALKPRRVLHLGAGPAKATVATDAAAITSWRRGWLLFDDVPLSQAAAEINRYRTVPIRLAPGAGAMRISGSFRTDGTTGFLAAVAATLPATVNRSPSGEATIVPNDEKSK